MQKIERVSLVICSREVTFENYLPYRAMTPDLLREVLYLYVI